MSCGGSCSVERTPSTGAHHTPETVWMKRAAAERVRHQPRYKNQHRTRFDLKPFGTKWPICGCWWADFKSSLDGFWEKLLWTIGGDFDAAKVEYKLEKKVQWDLRYCGCARLPPDMFPSQLNGSQCFSRSALVSPVLVWLLPESRVCDQHELSLKLMFKSYRWTDDERVETFF